MYNVYTYYTRIVHIKKPASLGGFLFWVGPGRLELPTSTMSMWRSNQLSYEPVIYYYSLAFLGGLSMTDQSLLFYSE